MSMSIQKAPVWKRISACIFDIMLVVSLTLVFLLALSAVMNFDGYSATLKEYLTHYQQQFQLPNYTQAEFDALTETQKAEFNALQNQAFAAFFQDAEVSATIVKFATAILIALSISLLLAYVIVYFLVALLFKNGQSLGKKSFGLAVMRTNGVKVSNSVLLIRIIVGMFVIETLFPLLLLALTAVRFLGAIGVIMPILLVLLNLGVMAYTPTNSTIHDLLCDTVVVDIASQEIFESEEALLEHKKRLAAEKAAQTEN